MEPYIGITDFTNAEQVVLMEEILNHSKLRNTHSLHVGVMSSYKTLYGLPTKWAAIFPPLENLKEIFHSYTALNCLHYADYGDQVDLCVSLLALAMASGRHLHAVQLDMIWPPVEEIRRFKKIYTNEIDFLIDKKEIDIILQIGGLCFKQGEHKAHPPKVIVDKLKEYDGVVDRVLLDKSMGRGKAMDAAGLLPYARLIREELPHIGIGIAGGLGPDSVHLIKPFLEEFPDVSIDAQGQLRSSGNAQDPIEWDRAEKYIKSAIEILSV